MSERNPRKWARVIPGPSESQPVTKPSFDLWLEFEEWQETFDPEDEFSNIEIRLPNGRSYALNVWTYRLFERLKNESQQSGENLSGNFLLPPDLFVKKLDRTLLEEVVEHLILNHELRETWLTTANTFDNE